MRLPHLAKNGHSRMNVMASAYGAKVTSSGVPIGAPEVSAILLVSLSV